MKATFYIDGLKYTTEQRKPYAEEALIVTKIDGKVIEPTVTYRCGGNGKHAFYINPEVAGATDIYFDEPDEDDYYVVTNIELTEDDEEPAEDGADNVEKPAHYNAGAIEVIDIIAQTVAGYDDPFVAHTVGTATKYLNRAPYKHDDPTEDLRKAAKYISFAIEHLTKEKAES